MKFQDYYELLGVPRGADADTIRRAYRKLALKWHPDRHTGAGKAAAEERFKRLSEAYEVLSDADKRAKYDRFGEHWKQGQEFTPPPGSGAGRRVSPEEFESVFGDRGGPAGWSDFFRSVFGEEFSRQHGAQGGPRTRTRPRAVDVRAELALPLGQALSGGKSRFEVPVTSPCTRCSGDGFVGERVCPSCMGVGSRQATRTVELSLPRPLRNGATLRLRGLGEAAEAGAPAGDLLLTLRFTDDETWRMDGHDLLAELPVAPWEALAGARVPLRTPEGTVMLSIPPGTRAGARLRLRGQGLDDGRGGRGDLHAVVRLVLPETLGSEERAALEAAGRAARDAGHAVRGGARGEGETS